MGGKGSVRPAFLIIVRFSQFSGLMFLTVPVLFSRALFFPFQLLRATALLVYLVTRRPLWFGTFAINRKENAP